MTHFHPSEGDAPAITARITALSFAQLQILYDLLHEKGSPFDGEQVDEENVDFVRRVVLAGIFDGVYTSDQLRPYISLT